MAVHIDSDLVVPVPAGFEDRSEMMLAGGKEPLQIHGQWLSDEEIRFEADDLAHWIERRRQRLIEAELAPSAPEQLHTPAGEGWSLLIPLPEGAYGRWASIEVLPGQHLQLTAQRITDTAELGWQQLMQALSTPPPELPASGVQVFSQVAIVLPPGFHYQPFVALQRVEQEREARLLLRRTRPAEAAEDASGSTPELPLEEAADLGEYAAWLAEPEQDEEQPQETHEHFECNCLGQPVTVLSVTRQLGDTRIIELTADLDGPEHALARVASGEFEGVQDPRLVFTSWLASFTRRNC